MNAMLRTDKLAKKFGKVEALTSLTLEVPEGSVFALVGPNGAGKTTAMKICLNMVRASSGNAEVLGVDSRKLSPAQLARIARETKRVRLLAFLSSAALVGKGDGGDRGLDRWLAGCGGILAAHSWTGGCGKVELMSSVISGHKIISGRGIVKAD